MVCKAAPPKKRKKEAHVLASSEFPTAPTTQPLSPLSMFIADEEEENQPCFTSTPKSGAPPPPLDSSVDDSHPEPLQQSSLSRSPEQTIAESVIEPPEPVIPLSVVKDLIKSEVEPFKHRLEHAEQEIFSLNAKLMLQQSDIERLKAAPKNLQALSFDVELHARDCEKVNENDSEVGSQTLDQETLCKIKTFSKSQRNFISNVARKMYSMEERVRDCNVAGSKNRSLLSPTKTRYERICAYTAQQYAIPVNAQLGATVRAAIDDTNRKYREELKRRKSKKNVRESQIVPVENDD